MLARDLENVSMLDLYRIGNFALPEPTGMWLELDGWSQRLGDLLIDIDKQIENDMGISLKSFYRTAPDFDGKDVAQSNVTELYEEQTFVAQEDSEQKVTG